MSEINISKKNTVVPFIIGIFSIIGALIPIIGIILGIVSIILSKKGFKQTKISKIALILGIIGLVLSLIIWIVGTIVIWKHTGVI